MALARVNTATGLAGPAPGPTTTTLHCATRQTRWRRPASISPPPTLSRNPGRDVAAEGRLLLMRCSTCGRAHYYPRPFLPRCGADTVSWEQASGDATLYTWSVVYQNDLPPFNERVPYVAAVVDLAEGPR